MLSYKGRIIWLTFKLLPMVKIGIMSVDLEHLLTSHKNQIFCLASLQPKYVKSNKQDKNI